MLLTHLVPVDRTQMRKGGTFKYKIYIQINLFIPYKVILFAVSTTHQRWSASLAREEEDHHTHKMRYFGTHSNTRTQHKVQQQQLIQVRN